MNALHFLTLRLLAALFRPPVTTLSGRTGSLAMRWLLRGLLLPTGMALAVRLPAQSDTLNIELQNNSVLISWPSGLDLVQPESSMDLSVSSWTSLGTPTTASSLTQPLGEGMAFYRLRFLAPTISQPPSNQTVTVGDDVNFTVTATGTAPLTYQWRKGDMDLPGKTGATLSLPGVSPLEAGNYSVVISNRAGSVTSPVTVLSVSAPPMPPHGIYMGNFAGQSDNGGFAALVRPDGSAMAVGYNTVQEEGLFISGFAVTASGGFESATAQGGGVSGTFSDTGVTGTFRNSSGGTGSFTGNRKADTGAQAANAGYYSGTYTGQFQGSAFALLAADGSMFFYTIDNPNAPNSDGDGGGFGAVNAANTITGTTVPLGLTITGTLNPATKTINGSYLFGGTPLGSFSLTRTAVP